MAKKGNPKQGAADISPEAVAKAKRRLESLIDGAESERVQLDAARHVLALAAGSSDGAPGEDSLKLTIGPPCAPAEDAGGSADG